MAEERVIKIVGDTSDADKKIKGTTDNLKDLDKQSVKTSKDTAKGVENVGKSAKKTNKSVGLLKGGFKALGLAIKATGIGLVVSLVASLGVAFSKNQRFIDGFSTVTETLGIVLSQVATAFFNVYDSVSKNTENFDALGRVVKSILTLSITPLKLAFYGIKLGVQQAQLAWEQSFFGGKDKEKINQLTLGIIETKKEIVDTGKEAIESGKVYVTSIGEAIGEVVDITKKAGGELSKINVKNAIETAKNNVQIRNTAKLAVAEQGRLVEIFDRQAEKQRQIRDEERNSIEERIQANNKLGKVLEEQEKAMLRQADAQIASANADLAKNNTIENQVALTEALANKEGVLAQVEGFRSEQLVNDLALKREQIELNQTISDAEKERRLAQLEYDAEQQDSELLKLEKQKEKLELENEIILEDLERKRELYKEGTLARTEAEQEFLTKKQEIDNAILDNDKKYKEESIKVAKEKTDREKQLEQSVADAKKQIGLRSLDLLAELAGKGSAIGKGVAVTQATISGIEGVQNAYTTAQKSPITALFPAYPAIQAGLAGAFSAVQIKKILSTGGSSSGGGATATSGGNTTPSAPSFNLVQGTESNQIAQSLSGEKQPVQAFVVGSNVTTQQELDRNKVEIGSI